MAKASDKLQPSRLDPETQLMQDDVNLDELQIFVRGKEKVLRRADFHQLITGGSVSRTTEGASTVTIDINDPFGPDCVQNSDIITSKTDINIDGLFFRLTTVDRNGDVLTLTFEDREVALLREQNDFRKASRATMTRAQFAESLVREQKEENIRFFSPEKNIQQPVAADPSQNDSQRGSGFAPNANVTVKGVNATQQQLNNLATVISVGMAMGIPDIGLLAAIETVTVESSAMNLSGGDLDSVGIFQQRNIPPWNKRNRRDVGQAATTFYEVARQYLNNFNLVHQSHLTSPELAQLVQRSAFPARYAQWVTEAQFTLAQFRGDGQTVTPTTDNSFLNGANGGSDYEFSRGTIDQYGRMTKETTWDCINRLAQEVNWRCFMVNGTVYFISEEYLFRSRPRVIIDATEQGIDKLDFTHDKRKANSQLTIDCHIARWGAPPGSVVIVKDHGLIDGRWLVQTIDRPLTNNLAEITCIKPLPILPEPPPTGTAATTDQQILGPSADTRQAIVKAAQKVLSIKNEYTYRQYRPMANSIFDEFAKTHTDCSAFVTLCYKAGGAQDPNGFQYNGQGFTGTLWSHGNIVKEADAQPGDLVFYGQISPHAGNIAPRHVALFIGNGQTIEFGSTHPNKGTVHEASDLMGIRSYM